MASSQPAQKRVEHLEDFTAHEWCNNLLSDPSVTHISKRHIPREGVSNTFFTRTLFNDTALRAFLSLYKPGKGQRREPGQNVFTGNAMLNQVLTPKFPDEEERRQSAKLEKIYVEDDPNAPEAIILVSIGSDLDGGVHRIHGGITATLLDQVMGTLISNKYQHTCSTADLTIKYKAGVSTPCILLVRAKLVREKGRWIEVKGWVEDGNGKVFAEGSGAFVMLKIVNAKM